MLRLYGCDRPCFLRGSDHIWTKARPTKCTIPAYGYTGLWGDQKSLHTVFSPTLCPCRAGLFSPGKRS